MADGKMKVCFCELNKCDLLDVDSDSDKNGSEFIFLNIAKFITMKWKDKIEPIKKSESPEFIIAFTKMKDLHSKKTYNALVENGLRSISNYKNIGTDKDESSNNGDKSDKNNLFNHIPLILICLENFIEIVEIKKKQVIDEIENENKEVKQLGIKVNIIKALNLDQRIQFFDSSIWHRYVALDEDFEKNLKQIVEEITKIKDLQLYKTSVAREFLEFKTRMMVNSYLAPVGESGHASHLIPYKFHSESLMKEQFEKIEKEENLKNKFEELRWKFLLIDDYALIPLRKYNKPKENDRTEECKEKGIPTKACIIKLILREILGTEIEIIDWKESKKATNNRYENNKNLIICVGSITDAKDAMQTEMFDMIFLDYLLGDKAGGGRELGSELLKKIQDDKNLRKNKGPLEKFWIFPISAFSYAMMDELREQGYGYLSDYWHISAGSDPIDTPWLFKYKLVKFLKQQINSSKYNIPSFLEEKFSLKIDVSVSARECYSDFINLRNEYRLYKKNEKKSLLAKTKVEFLEKNNTTSPVWDHLYHLLYLLAFGSGLEWSEMWEEFTFIKNSICNQDTNCENANYLKPIKKHIIKLQNEYR